jgi:lactoylglutathione lyase
MNCKKLILSIWISFGCFWVVAQDSLQFQCTFNHMAFPVKNVQVSVDFYTQVLHLKEITNRTANPNIRWISLGEGKELHLISEVNESVKVNKALHLALSMANVPQMANHLKMLGITYSDWPGIPNTIHTRADGIKQIYFQDPDGYWIEINNGYAPQGREISVKDTIWKLEEDYWVYVKNRDLKNYLQLWDENFKGYPSTNVIGSKANITDWIKDMYAKNQGKLFDYQLTRMEENVFDDIVIVLYDAITMWKNGKGEVLEKSTFKITHTWKKNPEGWRIMGGMGAIK